LTANPNDPSPVLLGPEAALRRFEQSWLDGTPLSLEEIVASLPVTAPVARESLLIELVKIELEYRHRPWANSSRPPLLEDYLRRFPELKPTTELIAAEYRVRQMTGNRPTVEEYIRRFPSAPGPIREALAAIDREIAEEYPQIPMIPSALAATPVVSVLSLLNDFRDHRILKASQVNELVLADLHGQFPDPAHLAAFLQQQGWLTSYQVEHLLKGRASDLVLGSYLILDRLGSGASSQVFKARHQAMNRIVALKVIRPELLAHIDAEMLQRFDREVQAAGQLSHPNVVHAFDAGPAGATHFLAMEFVDGTDLARLVQASGPLPIGQAWDFIQQAACGLVHAHERGLIHRDIKPSNLLVAKAHGEPSVGMVKIVDFGLANLQLARGREGKPLTREGDVMGTADYMAPEQAIDPHAVDIRADLYSLGCTFYYLLAGKPPFVGGSFIQKVERHRWEEPPPIQQWRPDLPPQIVGIVQRLLAKQPEDRYQTPTELMEAMRVDVSSGTTMSPIASVAPDSATGIAANKPVSASDANLRRWRDQVIVMGTVLGVIGVVMLGAFYATRPSKTPRASPPHAIASTPQQAEPAPLDRLQANTIPLDERKAAGGGDPANAPRDLVAVLGSSQPGQPGLHGLAFSPDARLLAVGTSDGKIKIWEIPSGKLLHTLTGHSQAVLGLAFHPKKNLLASAGLDLFVKLWDPRSGQAIDSLAGHRDGVRTVAFSPDGALLASAGNDARILFWDTTTRKPIRELTGHERFITEIAFAPDGKLLASSSDDRTARLWEVASGKPGPVIARHENQVSGVAFSPDGKLVATSDWSNLIKLSDVQSAKEMRTCAGHASQVSSVSFGKNDTLASGSLDGTVRLWDTAVGGETRTISLAPEGDFVRSVQFAPDRRHLAISTRAGTVSILRLVPLPSSGK
jgi:eukaryotic-like serine/threonine-protein kinase